MPAGATLVSGQGTLSIIVQYPDGAVSDTVRVAGVNNCAVSAERKLKVTLSACPPLTSSVAEAFDENAANTEKWFDVVVMPNPTQQQFAVTVKSSDAKTAVSVRIATVNGKLIETKTGLSSGEVFKLGARYKAGVYFAEIIQGNNRRVVRLVKQ